MLTGQSARSPTVRIGHLMLSAKLAKAVRCPYLQNSSRVVFVVCNASITLPSLKHDTRFKARIGHRVRGSRFLASNEACHHFVTTTLFFNGLTFAMTHEEEKSSQNTCECKDTNDSAYSNSNFVGPTRRFSSRGRCHEDDSRRDNSASNGVNCGTHICDFC